MARGVSNGVVEKRLTNRQKIVAQNNQVKKKIFESTEAIKKMTPQQCAKLLSVTTIGDLLKYGLASEKAKNVFQMVDDCHVARQIGIVHRRKITHVPRNVITHQPNEKRRALNQTIWKAYKSWSGSF